MTEITEGNKFIAEFMGMNEDAVNVWSDKATGKVVILGEYRPHSDWNELMPVVEKIADMDYGIEIGSTFSMGFRWRCKIYGTSMECHFISEREEKITDAVYPTVIQFIKWYNQNK